MANDIDDPFIRLAIEHERTLFVFHGWREAEDGEIGSNYFKLAYSLRSALADLEANTAVEIEDEGGYLVRDAFVERDDESGDPIVHVQLVSVRDIIEGRSDG